MKGQSILDFKNFFEDLTKEYEKAEKEAILFYSTDRTRDFRLLDKKVKGFKDRFNKLMDEAAGSGDTDQIGVKCREGDLQT